MTLDSLGRRRQVLRVVEDRGRIGYRNNGSVPVTIDHDANMMNNIATNKIITFHRCVHQHLSRPVDKNWTTL